MKVAHLTTTDISLRYLVLPQLTAVITRGGRALGISAAGPFVPELEEVGIEFIGLKGSTRSSNPIADLRAAFGLWRILRRERPDILHTHNPKPGIYGRIVGRLAGVPIVINTVHGLYATPNDRWVKRAFVYTLEAIAARFSDVEHIQSPEDLELMTRLHIIPQHKARLLGNGIDLERFKPSELSPAEKARRREAIGVDPETVVIGMVGRLVAEKGFPELIHAAGLLGDRYTVVAIGPHDPEKSDALPPELLSEAEQNGVRFLGMRKDVEDLYPLMDMFALPSHREGFPRAAMEAAASGLPVVATDIRGCRQVVDDGFNGFLTPLRDPQALAERLDELGKNEDLRVRMGKASRAKAEAEFDEMEVVRKIIGSYDELLTAKGLAR